MASISKHGEEASPGMIARMRRSANEIWMEWLRVTKPNHNDTTRMAMAVLGVVIVFTLWLAALDAILSFGITAIENRFNLKP